MGRRSLKRRRERRALKKLEARKKKKAERDRTKICFAVSDATDEPGSTAILARECDNSIADRQSYLHESSPLPTPSSNDPLSWSTSEDDAFFSDSNNSPLPRKRIKHDERPDFYDRDELPMIVVDEQRSLEVHISPELERTKGAEVLRLSTHEYFRRVEEQKKRSKVGILCLRDKIELLQKDLEIRKQSAVKEKEDAVLAVRKFWRDGVMEGRSYGGKMLKAALQNKKKITRTHTH